MERPFYHTQSGELAREAGLHDGDGRADTNYVRDDGYDRVEPGKFSWRARRKRHHDPVHEKVDEDAVNRAVDEWLTDHESQLAAGEIKKRGGAEGNEEMDCETEKSRVPSTG